MESNQTIPPAPQKRARSSRGWRIARRTLLGFAVVATMLAIFHTIENWRGKRAWEIVRNQMEARGEVLDWNAYVPTPVPPEQNFFAAPKMREWFVKDSMFSSLKVQTNAANPITRYPSDIEEPKPVHSPGPQPIRLAVFHILPTERSSKSNESHVVLRLSAPETAMKFEELLRERLSGFAISAVRGLFAAEWPDNRQPIQIDLITDSKPTVEQMRERFLPDQARLSAGLRLDEDGTNAFKVHPGNSDVYLAADYLEATDADADQLGMIRKALERPLTWIEGDYTRPFESPIPNFVSIRTVAQKLADRAECHLLLKNPQAALDELTLLHRWARRMSPEPQFLVSAMIHVAVTGLYVSVIQDGLRLHAWQEPQLLILEEQLREIKLLSGLAGALRAERAAASRTFEMSSTSDVAQLMDGRGRGPQPVWQKAQFSILSLVIPRGWIAQNRAVMARYSMETLNCIDVTNQTVAPDKMDAVVRTHVGFARISPYTILARIAVPNGSKAVQACVRTQAMVQEALAACALERYHHDHKGYPEALTNLVPRYSAEVPKDPIAGEPLKYRLSGSGSHLLYSVGWNQRDDGGKMAVPTNATTGDWVWR